MKQDEINKEVGTFFLTLSYNQSTMKYTWLKVTKKYRNGETTVYLPISYKYISECYHTKEACFEENAEVWGEKEMSGHNYGYELEWDEVDVKDNVDLIKKLLKDECEKTERNLEGLKNKIADMYSDIDSIGKNL